MVAFSRSWSSRQAAAGTTGKEKGRWRPQAEKKGGGDHRQRKRAIEQKLNFLVVHGCVNLSQRKKDLGSDSQKGIMGGVACAPRAPRAILDLTPSDTSASAATAAGASYWKRN